MTSRLFSFLPKSFALPKYSLLIPCFLLPWSMLATSFFRMTPWEYSGFIFIVIIFLCFFLAFGLSINFFLKDRKDFNLGINYAAVITIFIVLWSIITAFFVTVPWLSWTGAPLVGMGVLWYIMMVVMISQ